MNTLSAFVEPLGWALLHFLWQGAAVALLLAGFLRLTRRSSPQVRYAASGAALILMLAMAVTTVWWQGRRTKEEQNPRPENKVSAVPPARRVSGSPPPSPSSQTPALTPTPDRSVPPLERDVKEFPSLASPAPAVPAETPPAAAVSAERLRPLLPWLVGVWAVGVTLFSLRLLNGWRLVRRWRASGNSVVPEEWLIRFSALCASLRVSAPVRLLSSASLTVPVVIGWLKPVVLVPAGLFTGISPRQLEAILAHELAHVRRHDYLVNLLQTAVETILFYHPAVWWVSAQLRREREHCCDDVAASLDGDAICYARALTALEELRAVPSAGLSAAGGSLFHRIRRLVGMPEQRTAGLAWPLGILTLAAVAVVLPITLLRAAESPFTPPQAAHVSTEKHSAYCVHDGQNLQFVLVSGTPFSSSTSSGANTKLRTWHDDGKITWDDGSELTFKRSSASPDVLSVTYSKLKPDVTVTLLDADVQSVAEKALQGAKTGRGMAQVLDPQALKEYLNSMVLRDVKVGRVAAVPELQILTIGTSRIEGNVTMDYHLRDGRVFLVGPGIPPRQLNKASPPVTSREALEKLYGDVAAEVQTKAGAVKPGALPRTGSVMLGPAVTPGPLSQNDSVHPAAPLTGMIKGALADDTTLNLWEAAPESKTPGVTGGIPDEASVPLAQGIFGRVCSADELAKMAFGETHSCGLRAAWVLPSKQTMVPVGAILKSRIVFHNNGKNEVRFRTDSWQQEDSWLVKNAAGETVDVKTAWFTSLSPVKIVKLKPGEICEVSAQGVAVGPGYYEQDYSAGKIGAEIPAKEGDELTCRWTVKLIPGINDVPVPLTTGDVKFKVVKSLSTDIIIGDIRMGRVQPFKSQAGVARSPGTYDVAQGIKMRITRTPSLPGKSAPVADQNVASIEWYDAAGTRTRQHPVTLSPGFETDPIVWMPGWTDIWIIQGLNIKKVDFSKPTDVREKTFKMTEFIRPGVAPMDVEYDVIRITDEEMKKRQGKGAAVIHGPTADNGSFLKPDGLTATVKNALQEDKPLTLWDAVPEPAPNGAPRGIPIQPPGPVFGGSHESSGRTATAEELSHMAFGETDPCGLRAAWILDPGQKSYALGSLLKCRIVFHNNSQKEVRFCTDSWHQEDRWHVKTTAGDKVEVKTTWFTGLTPLKCVRLKPGEIFEVPAHGVAVGAGNYQEAYSTGKIGAELLAKEGDELICQWAVKLDPGINDINYRAAPGSLPASLTTGGIHFKVTAPGTAPAPPTTGVARAPGRYELASRVKMEVTISATDGTESQNHTAVLEWEDAAGLCTARKIVQLSAGSKVDPIVWQRGGNAIWIIHGFDVRKVDFTNPAEPKETTFKMDEAISPDTVPRDVLEEIMRIVAGEKVAREKELQPVVLDVSENGSVALSGKTLAVDELARKLAEIAKVDKKQSIVIRGDAGTPYEKIIRVFDAVHQAGLQQVNFAAASEPEGVIKGRALLQKAREEATAAGAAGENSANLQKALDLFSKGLDEFIAAESRVPHSIPVRREVAEAYTDLGRLLVRMTQFSDASVAFGEAGQLYRELMNEQPRDTSLPRKAAAVYLDIAGIMAKAMPGELGETQAAEFTDMAAGWMKRLPDKSPDDAELMNRIEAAQKAQRAAKEKPASLKPTQPGSEE